MMTIEVNQMTIRITPRFEDHLWYPILVKFPGSNSSHIIEMRGKKVNEWNDMVRQQWLKDTEGQPRGWRV